MAHLGICLLEQLVSLASSQTEAFSQLLIKDDPATTPRAEIPVLNGEGDDFFNFFLGL